MAAWAAAFFRFIYTKPIHARTITKIPPNAVPTPILTSTNIFCARGGGSGAGTGDVKVVGGIVFGSRDPH